MKLTRRQEKIIRILIYSNDFISGMDISLNLQVSERTIRNEIADIRKVWGDDFILSSKGKGYKIEDKHKGHALLSESEEAPAKRQILMLKHILFNKLTNFYDLADQYYISESTLEKDLRNLNEMIAKRFDGVLIQRKANHLFLDASETQKRAISTHFLVNEIKEYDFNFSNYINYFKHVNIVDLKQNIVNFLHAEKVKISDIATVSLVLHLGIMIDRIHMKGYLNSFIETNVDEDESLQFDRFKAMLEEYCGSVLPVSEVNYLKSLFFSKITIKNDDEKQHGELLDFIDAVFSEISDFYQLDFRSDEVLKHSLLIHLLSLIQRAKQDRFLNNPLIDEIKEHFPLIYDMSVFLSLKIQEHLGIRLYEDEIGYISLHLMVAAEKLSKQLIRVLVVNPYGGGVSEYIKQRILKTLGPHVEIQVSSTLALPPELGSDVDLILSTIALNQKYAAPVYLCSSIITDDELLEIKSLLILKKKREDHDQSIIRFMSQDLFFPKLDFDNKDDLLAFLCRQLIKQGYADEDYLDYVMQRETIAPTAFGNDFAIPHPIVKVAFKTAIAIATLKKPIPWGNQDIRMVFLFSLAPDNENLSKLYEMLVKLLEDKSRVSALLELDDFQQFIALFVD